MAGKEAAARIKINKLLEAAGWRFFADGDRPFLILKGSEFGGPVSSSNGSAWPHSIRVLIENISHEEATHVSGYATLFLDNEIVRPLFRFDKFAVDPHTASLSIFFVTEETHACCTSPAHKLDLHINLEYRGSTLDRKYQVHMWGTYDPSSETFRETLTDFGGVSGRWESVKWGLGDEMAESNKNLNCTFAPSVEGMAF